MLTKSKNGGGSLASSNNKRKNCRKKYIDSEPRNCYNDNKNEGMKMQKNKKGFAISGVLYPLLILTLFLVVQVLFMLQTRKNVLDKARTELADSVNASNQVYTNEELSTLIQDQKKAIDTLNNKVSTLESENQSLKNSYTSLNSSLSNYVQKSHMANPKNNILSSITKIYDGNYNNDLFSRDYNGKPNEYKMNGGAIYTEFKTSSALGLTSANTYVVLITFSVYGGPTDYSGGYPFQFAMCHGNRVYMRSATSDSVWGAWKQLS